MRPDCLRFFRIVLAIVTLLGLSMPTWAGDFEDALKGFTTDSYSDTADAIDAVAKNGNPRAAAIIEALQAEKLYFVGDPPGLYIKAGDGAFVDAATGAAAKPASDPDPVRLNNRLRGIVASAVGDLTLLSSDAAKRREAAATVFRTRNAAVLPTLEQAIAKETDPGIKSALERARAAIVAVSADAEVERLKAIATIRDIGDQDSAAILAQASAGSTGRVKAAADAALASVNSQIAMWSYLQNVWYGVSLGSVLLLAAIGLAITFGVMGIINMAHGEMVMIGAYTTYVVQEIIRTKYPALFDQSLFIAVPLAFVVTGLVGIAIERSIIKFLYGRPLETLLATFGLSLVLQQAVRTIFGANNREVGAPAFMSGEFHLGGLSITYGRMWIVFFAIGVFFALQLVLRATPFGLKMRAVTQNRRMASAMGIDTNRIDALAFGLGSGIAGIAGVALSQIDNVSPNLGQGYIIDSFMVVVFGGVGNLWGTLVAALTLGIVNKFLEPVVGAVLGKIAILVFIILFIQKRPRGLFALKGRAVEA
jgi:urea transport system permease protein